ncbi:hypothetical protein VCR5J5_1370165 [Vibrio crassostreae]|uniref:Uncharacterized protein n=1 Tax=Vibrio crassostreae TaxID=246167 RepID=A0A822MNT3_9VIBR|nr:hypothetical protein VCR5J5_1370165 [Vibrio crassostreae]
MYACHWHYLTLLGGAFEADMFQLGIGKCISFLSMLFRHQVQVQELNKMD